jgi:hypothetical protein
VMAVEPRGVRVSAFVRSSHLYHTFTPFLSSPKIMRSLNRLYL